MVEDLIFVALTKRPMTQQELSIETGLTMGDVYVSLGYLMLTRDVSYDSKANIYYLLDRPYERLLE